MLQNKSSAQKQIERGLVVAIAAAIVSGGIVISDLIHGARLEDFLSEKSDTHTIGVIFLGASGCSVFGALFIKLFKGFL
jgi:hypothetical protein